MGNFDGTTSGEAEVPLTPYLDFPVKVIGFLLGNPNAVAVTGKLHFRSQGKSRQMAAFSIDAGQPWPFDAGGMPQLPGQQWTVTLDSKPTTELTLLAGWE